MRQTGLISILLYSAINLNAQNIKFRDHIDKDSLFSAFLNKIPMQMREDFTQRYKNGNEQEKEFLLFMASMPKSSKKELIENFENRTAAIQRLNAEYQKLVPENYIVNIEFEPESRIFTVGEQITIKIYKAEKQKTGAAQRNEALEVISQNRNLKADSKELQKIIQSIGWTSQILDSVRTLLHEAGCISIENGKIATIGFARSAMGKYSYKIFSRALDPNEKEEYSNGCQYILYRDRIVLEYEGGAVGAQCFDKDR